MKLYAKSQQGDPGTEILGAQWCQRNAEIVNEKIEEEDKDLSYDKPVGNIVQGGDVLTLPSINLWEILSGLEMCLSCLL